MRNSSIDRTPSRRRQRSLRKTEKPRTVLTQLQLDPTSMVLTFTNVDFIVDSNAERYSKDEAKDIRRIVSSLSSAEDIMIDKTFVDFNGTKFEKHFIKEAGWKKLCYQIIGTRFCTRCSKSQYQDIMESFKLLLVCYAYLFLEEFGYDVHDIEVQLSESSDFLVYADIDTYQEWRRYPGKWQTWDHGTI